MLFGGSQCRDIASSEPISRSKPEEIHFRWAVEIGEQKGKIPG